MSAVQLIEWWDDLKCDISRGKKIINGTIVPKAVQEIFSLKSKIKKNVQLIRTFTINPVLDPVAADAFLKALQKTANEGQAVIDAIDQQYPSFYQRTLNYLLHYFRRQN